MGFLKDALKDPSSLFCIDVVFVVKHAEATPPSWNHNAATTRDMAII